MLWSPYYFGVTSSFTHVAGPVAVTGLEAYC